VKGLCGCSGKREREEREGEVNECVWFEERERERRERVEVSL
jgi:hypothetical protein